MFTFRLLAILAFASEVAQAARTHRKLRLAHQEQVIESEYIVGFTKSTNQGQGNSHQQSKQDVSFDEKVAVVRAHLGARGQITHSFPLVYGVAVVNVDEASLDALLELDQVEFVEQNQKVHTYAVTTQSDAPWGLDRLDQSDRPMDDEYKYEYTGEGVKVYSLDTGVRKEHNEFQGRVTCGWDPDCGDGDGHGTHVAAIIGGVTKGVAKNVDIVAVKVLEGNNQNGDLASILAGLDWVKNQISGSTVVVNLSVGLGADSYSQSLNDAVNGLARNGALVTVAAGNHNADACDASPASASRGGRILTVGATTRQDSMYSQSNRGQCVDILAPGQFITSAWRFTNTSTNTISGTSCAAPFVAGVAALLLEQDATLTAAELRTKILDMSVDNKISGNLVGTPNKLVNVEETLAPPPAPPPEVQSCPIWCWTNPCCPGETCTSFFFFRYCA